MLAWVNTSYICWFSKVLTIFLEYLRIKVRQLVGLGVHPAKGLHLLQVGVLRHLLRKMYFLVGSPLRRHHNASNLFHLEPILALRKNTYCPTHLWVLGRRNAIEESRDLRPQVGDCHKLLQKVLREDISVTFLLDVIRRDKHVLGSQMKVRSGDRPHSPVRLAGKGLSLVVGGCGRDHFVTLLVMGPCRRSYQLKRK